MADDRFSALSKDPRYRLPSRKEARTAVDPRFSRLFKDQDFRKKASVDRYGRKIKSDTGRKELERLYRLDKEPKDGKKSIKQKAREVVGSSDESEEESSGDDEEQDEQVRDPARDGGFSESSSSEEESSDEESDEEAELAEETAGQEQTEEIEEGEVTNRIAAVNLDWDHFRAEDIMAAASSFAPANGRVVKVTIYPSQFGRERMQREEMEGPPREIFASTNRRMDEEDSDEEDDEDDERIRKQLISQQANDGDEFDTTKLRQYQLDRLRYFYAVIECDSMSTAKSIYDQMDGREYLTTANFFDLRYVPDETSFEEDDPREECIKLPDGYRPNDFKTEALTHSKVKLTWDEDDTTRKEIQKRAFSRAEMDENDLQAYIGTDSSDADSVTSRKSAAEDRKSKKKEAQRQKMRAALGLGDEPTKKASKDEPVGDMQITFTSGLSGGKEGKSVFENVPQPEESTRERYIRKERERKQKRKEKTDPADGGDEDVDGARGTRQPEEAEEEDDPFNDPFFNDPAAAAVQERKAKKAEKDKKRAAKAAQEAEAESRRAELELLMAEDGDQTGLRHFDMREIEKAEKDAKKKGKKGKKNKKQSDAVEDDFKVETADPRFSALFESHEYAIDPTNPRFKGTSGMKQLLEEGRKKRKHGAEEAVEQEEAVSKKQKKAAGTTNGGDAELKGLVARLKSKKPSKR